MLFPKRSHSIALSFLFLFYRRAQLASLSTNAELPLGGRSIPKNSAFGKILHMKPDWKTSKFVHRLFECEVPVRTRAQKREHTRLVSLEIYFLRMHIYTRPGQTIRHMYPLHMCTRPKGRRDPQHNERFLFEVSLPWQQLSVYGDKCAGKLWSEWKTPMYIYPSLKSTPVIRANL